MPVNLNSPKIPSDSSVPHEDVIPKGTLSVISISNTNPTTSETQLSSIKHSSFSEKEFSDRSSKGTSSASIYKQASRFVDEYPDILSEANPALLFDRLYKMYAADTHPDMKGLNKAQKNQLFNVLVEIHQKGEVEIIQQDSSSRLLPISCNYFISPLSDREGSEINSRITLTLQSSKVKDVLPRVRT